MAADGGSGKSSGPPPLVVDKDAPLLLEEPNRPEKSAVKKPLADNAPCLVCHANYKAEPLAHRHARDNVGCVTCHAVGARMPVALFEVQGINFDRVAERLRYDWFRRWMLDPPRYEPASKMPKYADDAGRTAFALLGGDAGAQFDAIWNLLREVAR